MGALPSGAQEQIGPKGRKYGQNGTSGHQMGVPHIFFRSFDRVDDFTSYIKKIGPCLYEL